MYVHCYLSARFVCAALSSLRRCDRVGWYLRFNLGSQRGSAEVRGQRFHRLGSSI